METEKTSVPALKLKLIMFYSFLLNVFFVCYIYRFGGNQIDSGWSSPAAVEAEAVAAISCSGHGRAYLDSVIVGGSPTCECNTCYAGEDCSLLLLNCSADARSGDPLFLEPYWRRNAAGSAVLISGWHRMSYQANGENFISLELERHLRLLHDAVGNAITRDCFIVFGRKIYQKMVQYLFLNTMGVSRDTQLRILKLLKVILAQVGREGDIFKFSYETLNSRWTKLSNLISSSSRFSLQKISPQYCTYFHKIRGPSPAYAWVKCERMEETVCEAVLREAGIFSRTGEAFEAESRYTRLSLIKTKDDFDQLLSKIEALVSNERVSSM